jgi:predicted RNase H-like nuclease
VRYKSRVTIAQYLGVDLAWRESSHGRAANETGVVSIDSTGQILDAGWTRGVEETIAWVNGAALETPTLLFVDAPLVVTNTAGQRLCETEVGQRYGRWKVSANSTNTGSVRLAGVVFRDRLESKGWRYSDGSAGPPVTGRVLSECYPYTTLVGASEFGYDTERPRYKRPPRGMPVAQWRPKRAAACDELVRRLSQLAIADPPLRLATHPVTQRLIEEPSPIDDPTYKHREDLIDALLCAWTAALWARHGLARCQVLGLHGSLSSGTAATIIAPARPEQRLGPTTRRVALRGE